MYQNCIVPNSTPGFSYLTEHYNVSDDTLKNIIYKYRIETEDPEAVPSDAYVQAQLGMTKYVDASPMAKQVWEKFYKSPKEFFSKEEFGKAKEEALTMFPTEAVKVYTNSKGHYVLAVREPVTKFEPKHRKDFSSWAEYNDYLLAMGEMIPENERDVENQVVGNQPFTFRDGTTVTVPFKPNSQQEEALNEINDFLKSGETAMTLSGHAGTGKTSLMEVIAQKAKKDGRNIVFSASTNKAAAVLRDRVKSAGFTAQTLNKVFGISVEEDSKKPYDANNLVNRLNEAKVLPGSVVVIDEASMINEENYKILNKIAEDNGLQIIYVGDKGQLAPVNEEKVSKVFRNNEGRVATLTKVERTDDNAVLKEATNIRNGKPLSGESSFNKDGKGVAYVKKSNKKAIKDIVEKFVPMLRTNPDYFRILAYTNAAVAKYNEAVRRTLGYTDNTPRVNEPIVGYNNWGYKYDKNGGTYKFINSEAYKVTKVGSPKTITRTVSNTAVSLTAIPVTIQDNMGNVQKVDFIDIKGNEENKKGALILAKEKARLKNEAWKLAKSSPRRAEMLQAANAIEEFLFVNDDIIDAESTNTNGKHPTLQKKVFDFGYAMTVHKSQGSTFTHVLMDDADIATAKNNRSSWSNVSLNEYSGEVHEIDDMEVKESGNLFELVNNPDAAQAAVVDALNTAPSGESNNTNIRQQLEYVAVSRATDTVTVIANDSIVKKEDTPLNHLSQSKETITKDITQQALNQLEEIFKMAGGVKYENEMAKFLEKNPQWSSKIQQAIENTSKGRGVTIQTEALNITGNKFKNSLYRGQGYAPVIDAEGNLHLHTNYDSLSKLRTLSFDSTIEGAEHYGNRSARHPYIIEVDEEFLDTVVPKGEYEREKVNNGESFRYDEEFNEVRLSFKDELIIPKGKFNITQSNETLQFETFDDVMANIGWLQSLEERAEIEEYNGASEIKGRVHENDLKSLSNALDNTLGTYKGYDVAAILYDALALQNDTPGSPIAPSRQYKEFIDKGLIEREYHEGYTYYKPSKALINHLTKKLGLKERQDIPEPVFYQNPHTPFAPYSSYVDERLPFYKTSLGEVYGFVDSLDNMYLDRNVITAEHGIHEYTHIWDRYVAKRNPELWNTGVSIMKKTALWQEILNDENYGKAWQSMQGITPEKLESLVASEVHSRLTGKRGKEIMDNLAKKKGAKKIIAQLKQWLVDFWTELKSAFTPWTDQELQALKDLAEKDIDKAIQMLSDMTLKDFAEGVNPITQEMQEEQTQQQSVNEEINNVTQKHQGNWSRQEAQNNPRILYVFTDNTDRDSGRGLIPDNSWYSKKYGTGHHFPTMTAAVVRGLDNSRPISTQRWYHQGAKGVTGRWTDADVEEFQRVIRAELQDIMEEFSTGKYDTIMFPDGDGLFNTSISNITKARTPQLYQVLADLLHEYGFDKLIPADVKPSQATQQPAQQQVGYIQEPQSEEIRDLYENNDVIETDDGIKIPVAIGVTIQYPDALGGTKFKIESVDDTRDDQAVFAKTYLRDGTYSHVSSWSYGMMSGFNNVKVFAPNGEEITNIYRTPEIQKVKETHNTLVDDLGGGEQAAAEVQDAVKVAKKGMSFEEALAGQEAFFSKDEQAQIKQGLNGKNLQVMSVSRLTDPAFFSKEIVSFLEKNAEKPLNDPARVTAIEIWSKHDGLPIKDILDACKKFRVAPMVSFSITGLGGTALEGGVMKYQDMLEKVGELIKNDTLNPATTTVRIDPILPGVTNMNDIKSIVETAKSYGIKKFVTSLVQSYGYTEGTSKDRKVISGINNALATEGKTYDWDKYYGRDSRGKINFKPKQEVIDEIGKVLLELDKNPEITIQTCAFGIKGLKVSACLDPMIIERITGVDVLRKDGTYDRDTSRPECMCYGCHGDFFKGQNKKCYSSCAYCYAAHSGDNKLNYYNEDGTLKDNEYTRTERVQPIEQTPQATPSASEDAFISHPVQLESLGKETGERVVQVDAAWKESILLDLDSQLGMDISEEEKAKIIQQMYRVKDAVSEEEYNKAPTAERQEVNDKMEDYWRRNNQMNALMENEVGLTPTEIREVSMQIVDSISDIISEIQANPEKAKDYFPSFSSTVDLKNATRKKIVEAVDINNLIKEAKKRFENIRYDESNSEAYDLYDSSFELLDQADLILENWETIMELAADEFLANEGFSIQRDTKGKRFKTQEREFTGYDYDNYVDPQDELAIAEEGDEQKHWQVITRTIDAFNSMSDKVRLAYHNCYELDKDGNKILSKWGIPKRVNKVKAVSQTLRWTQGTLNIYEMIDALKKKEPRNPWLNQLINRLSDTSGEEADFQSQFYGVMHRHFQLYSIGQLENGVYASKTLNAHVALSDIMKSINAKYQMKSHPLFNGDGSVKAAELNRLRQNNATLKQMISKYGIRFENGEYSAKESFSQEDLETIAQAVAEVSKAFGYTTSDNAVQNIITAESLHNMQNKLNFAIGNLEKASKDYDPFNFEVEGNIRSEVMGFLTPIVEELEDAATNAFFDNGNMYQSYVIPSFLTQLFDSFKQPSEEFHKWVESFYGQSEWFKGKDGRWRLPWLERLTADPKAREIFDHKVQLNFNKHDYMRNMSPEEHTLSVFMEYFSERLNMKDLRYTPAWFRVPIQSNKPSSEFIRFYADRSPAYKENIVKNLYSMFLQEVSRIDTVRKRNRQKGDYDYIASWDEQGRKFVFLPFLNSYLMDSGKLVDENDRGLFRKEDGTLDNEKSKKLKDLLNKKVKTEETLSEEEEAELMNLVQEATRNAMQIRVDNILNKWEKTGILKAAEKIKGIKSLNHSVRENLENFLWNDFYAANSILQMTIVDKAFYPHATELQKRLAELHAPGTRGNKFATDYKGNLVSDGFYRTLLLTEFDTFVANIIDNITAVFDKKIANAPENEKAGLKALKEYLVGEKGVYRSIEVTNAQGYSSPSSYRKKAFMFGKWSQQAEKIYQKLLKGDYSLSDLEVAFQPLKPFVYGHLSKNTGVSNAPITKMPVPFQAKNAEYLLIMADALTRGEETGRPNLLRAIYDIMEQSELLHPTMGIDTVQFTSAIKSGEQGSIDIAPFLTMEGGEEGARTLMEKLIYQDAVNEDGTKYNYDSFIHKTDYDNYAIQQEVPPHFMDHSQAEGSQQRMNIPADLDFYDYDGNENYYSWKDPDGTEHKMNAKEFRKEYERVHAANIEVSFNKLTKELHLDSSDKRARNLALSEILQDEIMSSPRYGISLFLACQIDPTTGEFRIPKGDPIQAKRIEQLVNSIIKNRVNKQKIAGGPIVQVSNFGTSRQLNIKFHDKQGSILMTREEYEKTNPQESFEEYLRKNQAGVAHFEIFAPIGMKSLFEKFKNPDGTINLEAVEKCDPELLKVITGRIPNEDKYSIAHGKIVGFMPALAGDAIMFPWELTRIDDSDFDVDKRYTQRKVMSIVVDWSKVKNGLVKAAMKGLKAFQENNPAGYEKWAKKKRWGQSDRDVIMEQVEMFMDNPEQMKDTDALMASMYKEYERILREDFPYKTVYPKKGTRDANNNQIIDMQWAVMSNEMTADKLLNPGGFEIPKHQAYVIAAYRNSDGTISWEKLEGMTTKQLKDLATREMDLAWFDDHVQFYKQNAAGSNLIGVFAVNKVAHATLEGDGLLINVADFCGETPFTICDMVFEGMMAVDPTKDAKNMLIGKNIGSGIGASADTAKDPWLDSINVNMTTAGMFNALIRMGMPMEDAELFMAQDVIGRLMDEFNRKSLEEKTSIDQILQEKIDIIKKKYGYTDDSEINLQPLTREELKQGVLPAGDVISEGRETIDYKTLLAFQKVKTLTKAIRKPTFVTRLNSISAAVGPLIIDNIILEHKLFDFLQVNSDENTGFYMKNEDGTFSSVDMDDILFEHPILKQFSRPADSRNPDCPTRILFSDMPAGSSLFKSILKALPSNISDKIYDDRQLLSKLNDFFQSYLLVANDVIDTKELKYFIEEFPKDFIGTNEKKGLQEKYPDNAFVQAIQLDYDKKSKRAYLNVNTTGMKEQEKERLRMAWADLHKVNPELSTKLFTYAFFRGGIGFSPRTFMGLADYIKENIEGYVDTYRHFPKMDEQAMIEQFVRNNWENNTLAPMKGGENTKYDIDLENGTLFVRDEKDMADLKGVKFFKTKDDKHTYLWKLLGNEGANKYERQYVRIDPLGNNGEYVEISRERNMQAFDKTAVLENRNETPELPENSPMETEASDADTPTTMPESESQQAKNVGMLIPYVMKQNPRATQESAAKQMQTYRDLALNNKLTSGHKAYLVNLFKQAGLVLTQEEAVEKFKEFC